VEGCLPEPCNQKNQKQNELNVFNSWDENQAGSIKNAEKQKKDLIQKIKNSTSNIVADFKDGKVDISIECKNDALNKMIEADKPADLEFTFDSKNKRYLKTQVKRSDIETTVQGLRKLFFEYGDPLGYNELSYKKVANKFTNEVNIAKEKITKYDDGAVVNAFDKWKTAITNLRNSTNTNHADRLAEFQKWAGIVFGTGPGTFATDIKVDWFFDGGICDLGDNDNITTYIMAEAAKNNIANLDTKEKVWAKLGLYGAWREKYAKNTDQAKMDVYNAAADVVKAIDKVVEDYKKELENKQAIQNLGQNAYTDAEIEAMPEVKAAQKNIEDVTAKRDAKQNEVNALNDQINNHDYGKEQAAINAKYKEAEDAHKVNAGVLEMLAGYITSDVDPQAALTSVEEFNDYTESVKRTLDRDIAKAEKDLSNKQLLLDEFTAGTYDHIASLKTKVKDVEDKKVALEEATEELELLKKVYGK